MRNRREAILDVARERFASRGWATVTMSEVRVAAGASTGSLYHHFPDKEHLCAALYVDALAGFHASFGAAVATATSARTAIEAGVRAYLEWVEGDPDGARLLAAQLDPTVERVARPETRVLNAALDDRIGPRLAGWVRAGELLDLPLPELIALWIGPAEWLTQNWLSGRAQLPPTASGDVLAAGAWAALSGSNGPRR